MFLDVCMWMCVCGCVKASAYPVPHCSTFVMLSWSRLFSHASSSCLLVCQPVKQCRLCCAAVLGVGSRP